MKSRILGKDPTWSSVNYEYKSDDDIYLKDVRKYNTAEGWAITTLPALNTVVDQSTNQYSNLYLTDRKKLSDFIGLRVSLAEYPRSYVTFFADTYGWVDKISPKTLCWHITDSAKTEEEMKFENRKVEFNASTPYSNLSTEMMFEVEMLSDRLCRISHWDGYKVSYLTADDSNKTLLFDFDTKQVLDEINIQVFEYSLDYNIACINLYRLIDGAYYEFRHIPESNTLSFFPTSASNYIPNPYKNTKPTVYNNELPIYDSWVSYSQGINQNNIDINAGRSYSNLRHNYLLNTEYIYDGTGSAQINILPLKNHITSSSSQSRNNPFRFAKHSTDSPTESPAPTMFRDYTCLTTGGNENVGLENMYLTYRDYTRELKFKSDEVTYFHMPPDMYPFTVLNVAQAGLLDSGAIAGDQPARSDKIFKKRANYSEFGPWGDSIDEQSGTYLCTWLYHSGIAEETPIWVDRYYNPSRYTMYEAMKLKPIVEFISTFDNMVLDNPETSKYIVFDKISDLCFEPDSLYCYHRIGQTDITNSITGLEASLANDGFVTYSNSSGGKITPTYTGNNIPEYTFTGTEHAETSMLTSLVDTNSFSLTFSMYSSDWSTKFGHQLLGNYTDTGFGIFNQQLITPTLMNTTGGVVTVYNPNLDNLLTINRSPVYVCKSPTSDNIFIYDRVNEGTLHEYTPTGILKEQTKVSIYDPVYPHAVIYPTQFAIDDQYMYLIHTGTSYRRINLLDETVKDFDDALISLDKPQLGASTTTLIPLNSNLYSVVSDSCVYTTNKIYWVSDNTVVMYDTSLKTYSTVMSTTDYIIRSIRLDIYGNLYVVYREYYPVNGYHPHHLLKFDSGETCLYSVSLSSLSPTLSALGNDSVYELNPVLELGPGEEYHYLSLLTSAISTYTVIDETTGEPVEVELQGTGITNIYLTGELYSYQFKHEPFSKFTNISSSYQQLTYQPVPAVDTNTLTFQLKLQNSYNSDQYEIIKNVIDVSEFDKGWHQICYDYNTDSGLASLFVDSLLMNTTQVQPAKYRFSDVSTQRYVAGATPSYNGILLSEFTKRPGYYRSSNYKIKNLNIYNKSLNYYDIKFFYRQISNIRDMKWTIPGNSRNYIDEIQHVFNHGTPPIKSKSFDIDVLSNSISDPGLRESLSTDLRLRLSDQLPINTKCKTVSWYTVK